MKVYVKTQDELLASGWSWVEGALVNPESSLEMPATMIERYAGQSIELGSNFLQVGMTYRQSGISFGFTVQMLRAARLKTADELLASGWDLDNDGDFSHPDCADSITSRRMLDMLGGYIPVRVRRDDEGRVSRYRDCDWYPEMFAGFDEGDGSVRRTARERVVEFRDADLPTALAAVTCGFELETQETEGETWNGLRGGETRRDTASIEALLNLMLPAYAERFSVVAEVINSQRALPPQYRNGANTYEDVANRLRADGIASHQDMVARGLTSMTAEELDRRIRSYVRDRMDTDAFRLPALEPQEYLQTKGLDGELLHVGSDSSVSGFEIRTRGGLTPEEFVAAAANVFALDHDIDVGCSFHVHVKVGSVQHRWGERMQQALTEFLVENRAEVPSTVLDRWRTIRARSHIQPGIRAEKHSFVHCHPQGTWEFRCFGNVRTAADGVKCLELAVRAMQHAYRVVTGRLPLLSDQFGLTNTGWRDLCFEALETGTTMTAAIEASPNRFQSAA